MPKTLLITGATGGIGRHAALFLARRGHTVIATGRRRAALEELQSEAAGLPLHTVSLDVTDHGSIQAAVTEVAALGLHVDVLVNNAGFGCIGSMMDIEEQDMRRQFDTNVFGLMAVTRAFAAPMLRRRAGRIINVSSVGGRMTLPMMGSYNATKYAVESMSDAMRAEVAPFGVQVVLVEPGVIRTSFGQTAERTVSAAWTQSSPWAAVYQKSAELTSRFENGAPDPTPVSKAFARAIEAKRPRARYVAPGYNAIFTLMARLLPAWVTDALISRAVGLHGMGPSPILTTPALSEGRA